MSPRLLPASATDSSGSSTFSAEPVLFPQAAASVGDSFGNKGKLWEMESTTVGSLPVSRSSSSRGFGDHVPSEVKVTHRGVRCVPAAGGDGVRPMATAVEKSEREVVAVRDAGGGRNRQTPGCAPLSSLPVSPSTAKEHGSDNDGSSGDGVDGGGGADDVGKRGGNHPPYADMAVEAIRELREPRGSSLSAVAAWIRGSQYGGLLGNEGASAKEFKATVAVGIKQASNGSLSTRLYLIVICGDTTKICGCVDVYSKRMWMVVPVERITVLCCFFSLLLWAVESMAWSWRSAVRGV